ncbi:MAG: glutathione-disulfide reductase [Alphaproteobacteria bacterium]
MSFDYDLFVIGAGSGGVRASRMGASMGLKVAVAEDGMMGGTCVNVGCVPKKLFTYAGNFAHSFDDAKGYGFTTEKPKFDWKTLRTNKDNEINRLNGIYNNMLKNAGVEIIDGYAVLKDKNTVTVNGKDYTAERILITVGSTPVLPNIEGIELAGTSFDAFYMDELPNEITVVGGGYIAVEFASIFASLGAKVKLLVRSSILKEFDGETVEFAKNQMEQNGVEFITGCNIEKLSKDGDKIICHTDKGDIQSDFVMYATGRKPYVENLGLENAGVKTENGAIVVNDDFQTNVPSIYALGDVINRMQLTPVALGEAMVFLNRVYGDKTKTMDYSNIATAVFCYPNMGTVGLSQEDAIAQGYDIDIYKSDFKPMKNTLSGSPFRSFMKLVVDTKSDRVLGAHMVGDDAGEIIQGIGIAVKAGLTKADFDNTIGIHPTSAEEFVTMRTKAEK